MESIQKFDGQATIRVIFRNRAEYEKFRKYVLRTEWSYDLDFPLFEEIKKDFHNVEDINQISMQIVWLLQLGFHVQACRYQLESELAELEHPEEDQEEDHEEDIEETYSEQAYSSEIPQFDIADCLHKAWDAIYGN